MTPRVCVTSPTLLVRRSWLARVAVAAAILLPGSGCGGGEGQDPCPGGICPVADASGPGIDGGGGTRPDGGGGAIDSGPGCVESWLCSPWSTDGVSDDGVRTCVDQNACGTTVDKPVQSATLPALDYNYYQCNVEPIMDWGCSMLGCHGTEQGRGLRIYARGRLRIAGETLAGSAGCFQGGQTFASETCTGSIECHCFIEPHLDAEWRANYDAARGFALRADGTVIQPGAEEESELLAQPLIGGGFAHAGIHMFQRGDARYNTIRDWLAGATLATCATTN
jgi:hypothetical protein